MIQQGDCRNLLTELSNNSVDAVICDPPYNVTNADWDSQPFDWSKIWKKLHRVSKPQSAFVFTARQPFTTTLIQSNIKNFRHALVWIKESPSGALNAKKQPMPKHEDIAVFYRKAGAYNSGATEMERPERNARNGRPGKIYEIDETTIQTETGHATSVIKAGRKHGKKLDHPTQKPVDLFKRLIEMYSEEGEVILDFTAGSGTTAIAAIRANREFICFEKDEEYFQTMEKRVYEEQKKKEKVDQFFDL